jgi:hypothetical protein
MRVAASIGIPFLSLYLRIIRVPVYSAPRIRMHRWRRHHSESAPGTASIVLHLRGESHSIIQCLHDEPNVWVAKVASPCPISR